MKSADTLVPSQFEAKWQAQWLEEKTYQPEIATAKKPFYNLMMFPYPSAEGLHVGNMYAFTGADIYGRFMRMQGNDVFEPIGLDGFGIHSENYALKVGRHPKEQAKKSEQNFYRQLTSIGNSFAWNSRLETYDPHYYRWTQWLFVEMFKHGLAYRKSSPVNFCPSDKTVLSDEQVIDGKCERCGSEVEKRHMEQWFFRITDYAGKLLDNTYNKDFQWPEKVKIGQRNWIGKKEGIIISYHLDELNTTIDCFTTRPDTNFGATFIVIGPEHPFVSQLLNGTVDLASAKKKEVQEYVDRTKKTSDMDRIAQGRKKTGVFTGFHAINQLTDERMPVYISDFVLGNVGTGAVVGVPGHDLRDFEFAKVFDLPVIRVVVGPDGDTRPITEAEQVQEEEGTMVNSGFLNGKDIHEATGLIMDYLEEKGWGKRVVTYRLRDWCISRQRYWGAPIPMIYCHACADKGVGWLTIHNKVATADSMPGWYPVPDDQLPVLLPDVEDWKPEGTGKGPLAKVPSFVQTSCPHCGSDAVRETDVCDTFLDSSWYFLRYPFANKNASEMTETVSKKEKLPWDPEILKKWLPVDMYIGGAEHTVLHLLYARFVTMALKDFGYLNFEEPFSRFYAHGLIIKEGAKMSKSKGNIVNPDEYIQKYGSDTLRSYLMFLGPFDAGGDFRDTGIAGMYKFLSRVWRLVRGGGQGQVADSKEKERLNWAMHRAVKEVTEDLQNLRYNTAIAHIMEYVNELTAEGQTVTSTHLETLLLLLAPFAPHLTEELYQQLKQGSAGKSFSTIHKQKWPSYDSAALVEDTVTVVVQVNGKVRDSLQCGIQDASKQENVEKMALESEKVKKFLEGKTVRKVIFVSGRLISFVV